MGGQISKMMGKIFGSKEMRLLMLGLDAAGKTSMSPIRVIRILREQTCEMMMMLMDCLGTQPSCTS